MKKFAVLAAVAGGILFAPATGTASPGGIDRSGGHHCWKNCARYGLSKGQYHCHRSPCSRKTVRRHRAHGH